MHGGDHLILIIEDEDSIRKLLRASLGSTGYRVVEAATGEFGLRTAALQPPDLVLLDLGLPDEDGQQILVRLRDWYRGPIIVLSARDQESQKVRALDSGADDYVTKPFGMGELLARIRNALRHAFRTDSGESTFRLGDLRVDLVARLVFRNGQEVHLTPIEYKLFAAMIRNAGKVLTHRYLLREVWGPDCSQENHYLRVFVANLRRKLEADPARPQYVLTEQGVGYRLATESTE